MEYTGNKQQTTCKNVQSEGDGTCLIDCAEAEITSGDTEEEGRTGTQSTKSRGSAAKIRTRRVTKSRERSAKVRTKHVATAAGSDQNLREDLKRGFQHIYKSTKTTSSLRVRAAHNATIHHGTPRNKNALRRDSKKEKKLAKLETIVPSESKSLEKEKIEKKKSSLAGQQKDWFQIVFRTVSSYLP
jgi:hypothetical protein